MGSTKQLPDLCHWMMFGYFRQRCSHTTVCNTVLDNAEVLLPCVPHNTVRTLRARQGTTHIPRYCGSFCLVCSKVR
jgi:hypothetical protein